jgi:putative aldouronate transport system permease protein
MNGKQDSIVTDTVVAVVLTLLAAAVLIPFALTFFSSFASEKELLQQGIVLWPDEWNVEAYRFLLNNVQFTTAFRNAVTITVVGTVINMILSTLMAYGLSHSMVKGRSFISFLVVFTMLFHGGMIPTYLVVKSFGLINSFWAIWLVNAIMPFNMIAISRRFQVRFMSRRVWTDAGNGGCCGRLSSRCRCRCSLPLRSFIWWQIGTRISMRFCI